MRKLPKTLTQEEFERIFKATLKIKKRKKFAIAMLLGFEAGMRISEVIGWVDRVPSLKKANVDMDNNSIRVISGKGQKDRIVPLPKRFNRVAYSMLPLGINRRSLQRWVTELGKKVLNKNISFHTLRHGFATHLVQSGRPLHEIQLLCGHSRLDTTGIYLHANPKKALEGARDVF